MNSDGVTLVRVQPKITEERHCQDAISKVRNFHGGGEFDAEPLENVYALVVLDTEITKCFHTQAWR